MPEGTSIRWVSQHHFPWSVPFLTFEGRKLELLAWFEANTEPVQMLSKDDMFGVGFEGGLRIQIHRGGIVIERVGKDVALPPAHVVEACCQIMGATELTTGSLNGVWSIPLEDLDYTSACRAFATQTTQSALEGTGAVPVDAALLFDALVRPDRGGGSLKIEYGIVTPSELSLRLGKPHFGRLDGVSPTPRPPIDLRESADQPEASLFAEVARRASSLPLNPGDVPDACETAENFIGQCVLALTVSSTSPEAP